MASILIKNVPAQLHGKLKERAQANRRSLNGEVLFLLEEATGDGAGPPSLDQIDRARVRGPRALTDGILRKARRLGRP